MLQKIAIRKLIDYILLNAYSVNSTGLYNGKAGISLCLFNVSKLLQDEYIEEQACELLQESLLSTNKDISFENGLAGIGYTLLYLIDNKFIDANFIDLFGDSLTKIAKGLELIEKENSKNCIKDYLKVVFFLNRLLKQHDQNYNQIKHWILFLQNKTASLLEEYISAIEMQQGTYIKSDLLPLLETYLRLAVSCSHFTPSLNILNRYGELCRRNKLVCSFPIGHYLGYISKKQNIEGLQMIAETNKSIAIKNLYPETMSLSERIDLLYLFRQYDGSYSKQIEFLEKGFFDDRPADELERNLLCNMNPRNFIAGYQSGIARYLLYLVNRYSHHPCII